MEEGPHPPPACGGASCRAPRGPFRDAPPAPAEGRRPGTVPGAPTSWNSAFLLAAAAAIPWRTRVPRQPAEQLVQPLALGAVERRQQLTLGVHRRRLRLAQAPTALRGQLEQVAPPILGVAAARQELGALELVDQPDQVARVDPERPPERLLGDRARLGELVQHRVFGGAHAEAREG